MRIQEIVAKLKQLLMGWQNKDVAENATPEDADEDVLKAIGAIVTQLLPPLIQVEQGVKEIIRQQEAVTLEDLRPLSKTIYGLNGFMNMSRASNQFAVLIHELRQPLAESEIALELLIETIVSKQVNDEERQEWLLIVQDGIESLKGRAEVFSALAAGDDTLFKTSIDLVALIAREAQRAGNLQVILPNRPIGITGHEGAIQQVFRNILGNAKKYGNAPFQISVTIEDTEKIVVVSVRDHGSGIPQEELGNVHLRGYRASNAAGKQHPGDGLGLWLSWQIMRAMNGSLRLENHPGGGAQVSFVLPCAKHES